MSAVETFEDLEKRLGKDLYPIYKEKIREPLIRDGFGSKGALMENVTTTNLMCHECGNEFAHLGRHIGLVHGKTAREYKDDHGLARKIGLVSKVVSKKISDATIRNKQWLHPHMGSTALKK